MRSISITIILCAGIILLSGCANYPGSTHSTATSIVIISTYPTNNAETAYPLPSPISTFSDTESFKTAYPLDDGNSSTTNSVVPTTPNEAIEPISGMASISGVLYSYTIKQAIPGTGFYLLPAVGPEKKDVPPIIVAPDPSKGDIISQSDNQGVISLNNIPPGNYYLVVWAPMNWTLAQISEEDPTPLLLELKAGSRLPLGVIYLSWP